MLKTILAATCASALLAGTALAGSAGHSTKADHSGVKSGERNPAHAPRTTTDRARPGAAAGASSQSVAPECGGMASEEEVTRCLNRHMAQMAERGVGPDGAPKR